MIHIGQKAFDYLDNLSGSLRLRNMTSALDYLQTRVG
jgi:hypothetical protein